MATKTIGASVGRGGANNPQDVRTIQQLLNQIRTEVGGRVQFPVPEDGRNIPSLEAGIACFQQLQRDRLAPLRDDQLGLIEPRDRALDLLNELTGDLNLNLLGLPPVRQMILTVARNEMGRVSDRLGLTGRQTEKSGAGDQFRVRFGWKRLQQYMTEAMEKPPNWGTDWAMKFTTKAGTTHKLTQLEGVKYADMRPPIGAEVGKDNWNGVHWCGIFATWVLKNAGQGLNVIWGVDKDNAMQSGVKNLSPGPKYPKNKKKHEEGYVFADRWGEGRNQNLLPGDVCVIPENSHHFIVEREEGDVIHVIEGNSYYQGIQRSTYRREKIVCTYRAWPS